MAQMTQPADFQWELIIVDNNSKDDTPGVVNEFSVSSGLNLRYVFEEKQGLSHARNRGIQEARGDIVVFTDDDVTVDSSWLYQLASAFEGTEFIAAGGKTLPLWHNSKPRWYSEEMRDDLRGVFVHFDLGDERGVATRAPFGANMAFRRTAFCKYGLFRTDLGRCGEILTSGEETEFFRRLMNANETVQYVPSAIVYHPVAPERLQKSYVQSVFYNAGRSQVREEGAPSSGTLYFGVPRHLFRMITASFIAWLTSTNSTKRFLNKLNVYLLAGKIFESHQKFRSTGPELSRAQRN